MPKLTQYNAFEGRHPETGTLCNVLAYQGIIAPHTGGPINEALLLGISGGIAVGYFTFEYEGYPPHIALLTRNTFDPLETLFDRLAIARDTRHTNARTKAEENLTDILENDQPAIVWADMFSLPYNQLPYDERNWRVQPVVVYGLEDGQAYLADRAQVPVIVDAEALQTARERIKKYKFRAMSIEAIDLNHLPSAVSKGIWQCISLYTDAPPQGKRDSFGLAALKHWAKMLTNQRNKHSWARYFPPGERLWMAIAGNATQPGVYSWINHGAGNSAERGMYADFLDEAAVILSKPGLGESAAHFRQAEAAWAKLAALILPQHIATLKETGDLLARKRALFIEQGAGATEDIQQIHTRLHTIQQEAAGNFPISENDITAYFEALAGQLTTIHDIEQEAVNHLQSVMS